MENSIFPLLLSGIGGLVIMYFIIQSAVRSGNSVDYRNDQMRKQTDLLIAIAKKHGVSDEEINQLSNQ